MNWGSCLLGCLMQLVSSTKQTSHNHRLFSLSATVVTSLWLKQPTCFFSVENGRKKICKNSQDFLTPNLFCASTKIAHTGCCYQISTVDPALNTNKLSSPSFMPLSYNQWFFSRAFWGGNNSPPQATTNFSCFFGCFSHFLSPQK